MNTAIGFKVTGLEKAIKKGFMVVNVIFDSNDDKEYNYIRKAYTIQNLKYVTVDGCKIKYNPKTLEVVEIIREFEPKGAPKKDTSNHKKYETNKNQKEQDQPTEPVKPIKSLEIEVGGIVKHEEYDTILTCIKCNIPIYLSGPAGSGKNFTVEQIAEELGMNFYFSNSVQQEYKLTGFIDAGGKFHETEFYKACMDEKECIFFLDEMDASIPEVLVLLNAAIANGYFEFPNGKVTCKHVNFVAAGNTVGSGADEMYTGRMVLDQATLDRFSIIEFGYSLRIEMNLTNGNVNLVAFIRDMREQAKMNGIRTTFSYRCMMMVTKLEASGMQLDKILKISVFKGLDQDTINTFHPQGTTKYHIALNKIQMAA